MSRATANMQELCCVQINCKYICDWRKIVYDLETRRIFFNSLVEKKWET